MNSRLESTDAAAAAHATHPRVTLADIEGKIKYRFDFTLGEALEHAGDIDSCPSDVCESLRLVTVCALTMNNGFSVIGKSAPASPENFDAELGRSFAYEDAVRQLWPLEGYLLRERLAQQNNL